jgi:hypothetical protein
LRFTAGTDPDDRRRGDYGDLDVSIFCFLQLGQILTIGGVVTTVTWTDLYFAFLHLGQILMIGGAVTTVTWTDLYFAFYSWDRS